MEDTANESSDLQTGILRMRFEAEGVTGEEEEEDNEQAGNVEENEEDEPVSTMTWSIA